MNSQVTLQFDDWAALSPNGVAFQQAGQLSLTKVPNPKPSTLNPKQQTSNPKPQTPNPKPQTPNHKPQTTNPIHPQHTHAPSNSSACGSCQYQLKRSNMQVWGLVFGVWGLGFGVWGLGLGFGVWGLGFWGFGCWGLGFEVWGLGFGLQGLEFQPKHLTQSQSRHHACGPSGTY